MNQKEAFRETLHHCEERWPSPMFDELSIEHMRDMLRRIDANCDATAPNGFSEAKLGRWLGYVQGAAVALGVMILDECKEINKKWADGAAQDALSQAARDVLAERQRQTSVEGGTPEHDDVAAIGQMAAAAGCYAIHSRGYNQFVINDLLYDFWPWGRKWWKPTTTRRDLVKAGALILAEIERLDRAAELLERGTP